jgi:membrane fusion protein (multidrug efflux system)
VVPEEAILPLGGTNYVWTVTSDGTAERVEVELGVRRPGWVEIRRGLEAGTTVVTGGQALLFAEAPVRVIEGEAAGAAAGTGAEFQADSPAYEP